MPCRFAPSVRLVLMFAVFGVMAFAQVLPFDAPANGIEAIFQSAFPKIASIVVLFLVLEFIFGAGHGLKAATALVLGGLGILRWHQEISKALFG